MTAPGPPDEAPAVPAVPDVSVVLPVYNEAGHVEAEVKRVAAALDASPYSYEIVVVDDASTDDTPVVARRLAADLPAVTLLEHPTNRGAGGARRTGTRVARGHTVVWTDVDMTYPNERIPELVAVLLGSDAAAQHDAPARVRPVGRRYDQVVGARTSEQGSHRALRVPVKWAVRRLAQYLVQTPIPDLNSGFRAFRRDVGARYLDQLPNGFSCVTTMTMSFLADGYSVGYLPIDYHPRAGESKFHWYRDTRRYLLQVVRMVLSYHPLRVFMPTGLALLLLGLVKLAYDVATKDLRLASNTLLILFAALQVISIGLLADLVVRATKAGRSDE